MADEKAPEGEKKDEHAGPKLILGMPLPQFAFVVVNVLVMVGALVFIIKAASYKRPPITEEQAQSEIQKKVEKAEIDPGDGFLTESYAETTITIRGQPGGKNRYATVEVAVVCGNDDCLRQVKGNKAKVEDIIQTAIGGRTYTELRLLDTKFRVKNEILTRVNALLEKAAAKDVLFTNFVLQ